MFNIKRITAPLLALLFCLPLAAATSYTFSTSFDTDANQAASATATFIYSGSTTGNNLTVTLKDTTVNPASDAPNLAEIAFIFSGGPTSGSTASASGATVSNIAFDSPITTGSYSGSSPWDLAYASSGWWNTTTGIKNGAFDLYAPAASCTPGPGKTCPDAPYSIVGQSITVGSSQEYTNPDNLSGPAAIGSANYLNASSTVGTMFYETATFTLSIPNLTQAEFDSLANAVVVFGYGPDSANNPDADDISVSSSVISGGSAVPEPSSIGLMAIAVAFLGLMGRRKMQNSALPALAKDSAPVA